MDYLLFLDDEEELLVSPISDERYYDSGRGVQLHYDGKYNSCVIMKYVSEPSFQAEKIDDPKVGLYPLVSDCDFAYIGGAISRIEWITQQQVAKLLDAPSRDALLGVYAEMLGLDGDVFKVMMAEYECVSDVLDRYALAA